jgi:multiple sugar transport system permease protein
VAHAAAGGAADGQAGIAAAALFQFFYCWNDYYGPLLYTSENERLDALAGPGVVPSAHHVDWNLVTAATVLAMAP